MTNNIGYGVVYTPDSLSEYVAALLLEEFNKDIPTDSVNSKSITILEIILPNWIQGIGKIKRYALAV